MLRSAVVGGVISSLIASLGFYPSDYRHLGDVGSWKGIAAISAWGAFLGVGRETTLKWRQRGRIRYYGAWATIGTGAFMLLLVGLYLSGGWEHGRSWWPELPLIMLVLGPGPGIVVGWWMRCWGLEQ